MELARLIMLENLGGRFNLSVAGLRRGLVRQAEAGACGRLLVRHGRDAKVATAG